MDVSRNSRKSSSELVMVVLIFSQIFFILSTAQAQSPNLKETNDDTVTINVPQVKGHVRRTRQFSAFIPEPLPAQLDPIVDRDLAGSPCESLQGNRGNCTTISQCFPLIFSSDEEESRNPGLIDVFKALSGVCESNPMVPMIPPGPPSPQLFYHLLGPQYAPAPIPIPLAPPPFSYFYHRRARAQNELICCTSEQEGGKPGASSPSERPPPPGHTEFVVGGSPTEITKFPWAVSLFVRNRHVCGGSLISKYTVLTAAHCVKDMTSADVAGMKVFLGFHDISQSSSVRGLLEVRTPAQIKYHKGFSMKTLMDDLALIILSSPAPTDSNPKISPVTLSSVSPGDKEATVAGWGQTSWGGPTSSRLLEATFDIWTQQRCQAKYSNFQVPIRISDKQICAGSPGKDSCRGDSGGPLHVKRGDTFHQVGIVSFGGMCGVYPGVYTNVASYSDWIQKNRKD